MIANITPQMWLTLGLFGANVIFMAGGFCWLAFNHFRSMGKRLDMLEGEMKAVRRGLAWLKGRSASEREAAKRGRR